MTELGQVRCDGDEVGGSALERRVRQVANGFAVMGIGAGDRVALLMRNSIPFVEASLAGRHLGAYVVPINWHGAPQEIAHVLADCQPSVLIGDPILLAAAQTAISPDLRQIYNDQRWSTWRDGHSPVMTSPAAEVASMIYTSGTTGHPKGVQRFPATADQAKKMASIRSTLYGVMPDMRTLMAAPLYHSAPNFFGLTTVQRGGLLLLHDRFDAEAMLAAIADQAITHLFAVPTMFVRLLALPPAVRARYDLSSLRVVVHAGAACAPDVKTAMIAWLGPILQEYYGSTEMGAVTFCTSDEWLRRPGTVGRPVDPYKLSIHLEDGSIATPGTPGEIWVEAPGLPDFSYHGDPAKRDAMRRGSAIASGDIGYQDADGYLFICDRKTDMIVSGGVNVYPAEIEAALMTHLNVLDCAVFGLPNEEYGEEVVAAVTVREPRATTPEALRAHLRGRIADYKIPRRIILRDTLPREESGKMFKRKLQTELMDRP